MCCSPNTPTGFIRSTPDEARLDPRHAHREHNVAYANFGHAGPDHANSPLVDWWSQALLALADAGVGGFRFDSPHRVPRAVWQRLDDDVWASPSVGCASFWRRRRVSPGRTSPGLEGAGFDSVFSSVRWWNFRDTWLFDEHAALTPIAAPVTFPEAPYGTRLAKRPRRRLRCDRRRTGLPARALFTAAALGTGWLVPMGFEYGIEEPMSPLKGDGRANSPPPCAAARFDLSALAAPRKLGAARYRDVPHPPANCAR